MKINKGHYHEITDRIYIEQSNIENNLMSHPVILNNKKLMRKIRKAQNILGDVYQKIGLKI